MAILPGGDGDSGGSDGSSSASSGSSDRPTGIAGPDETPGDDGGGNGGTSDGTDIPQRRGGTTGGRSGRGGDGGDSGGGGDIPQRRGGTADGGRTGRGGSGGGGGGGGGGGTDVPTRRGGTADGGRTGRGGSGGIGAGGLAGGMDTDGTTDIPTTTRRDRGRLAGDLGGGEGRERGGMGFEPGTRAFDRDPETFDDVSSARRTLDRSVGRAGAVLGDVFFEGPDAPEATQFDEQARRGFSGQIDTDITDRLTRGRGVFSDETIEETLARGEARREFFGVGEEAEAAVTDVTGSERAGAVAGGLGAIPGDVAALPSEGAFLLDVGVETAVNLPGAVEEEGAADVAATTAAVGGSVLAGTSREAVENPFRFGGQLAGELALGLGAGRAVEAAPGAARSASIRARGGDIVDVEDISDPPTRTEGLGLPGFTREAQADPEVAREEFIEQARQGPVGGDDPVAFSVRAEEDVGEFGGFGREFEAPEGGSEVPGQFFAADISNLRLPGAEGSGLSMPRIGAPQPSFRSGRVLAEEGVDVGITEGRTTGEIGEFLAERASREQSFIRTDVGGGPTPEQEVVAPPGSRFQESGGVFGVRVGGRSLFGRSFGGEVLPGRLTERVGGGDVDVDAGGLDETLSQSDLASETSRAITESRARQASAREPFVPLFGPGPGTDGVSDGVGGESAAREVSTTSRTGAGDSGGASDLFGESVFTDVFSSEAPSGRPESDRDMFSGSSPPESPPSSSDGVVTSGESPPLPGSSGGPSGPSGPSSPPPAPPSESPPAPPSSSRPPLFGPPSGAPSGPPTVPGLPGVPSGPSRQRRPDREEREDEDDAGMGGLFPAGQTFANPIQSAEEGLFEAAETFSNLAENVPDDDGPDELDGLFGGFR